MIPAVLCEQSVGRHEDVDHMQREGQKFNKEGGSAHPVLPKIKEYQFPCMSKKFYKRSRTYGSRHSFNPEWRERCFVSPIISHNETYADGNENMKPPARASTVPNPIPNQALVRSDIIPRGGGRRFARYCK
jgi:hypothetical protein